MLGNFGNISYSTSLIIWVYHEVLTLLPVPCPVKTNAAILYELGKTALEWWDKLPGGEHHSQKHFPILSNN